MQVYIIRHGQTDWNVEGRFQGQTDIPLNPTGQGQAVRNGQLLAHILGDGAGEYDFIASPLGRTRETMERIRAEMGLDPQAYGLEERLKEICFGDWEGHTTAELKKLFPQRVKERSRGKWDFIAPGEMAESYEILSWRTGAWMRGLLRPTVAVTHGGVIRSFFRLFGSLTPNEACTMEVPQDRVLSIRFNQQEPAASELHWL
ncbi:histidine phosphatase family protein [Allorhizobium undicola]|uniref:histidine phosphatase family protein n=1 Tax=Allorhizobium undicola TaxID=78527 RepID=UPI003D341080